MTLSAGRHDNSSLPRTNGTYDTTFFMQPHTSQLVSNHMSILEVGPKRKIHNSVTCGGGGGV